MTVLRLLASLAATAAFAPPGVDDVTRDPVEAPNAASTRVATTSPPESRAAPHDEPVTRTLRVAVFKSGGTHPLALSTVTALLENTVGFELEVVTGPEVARGALDEVDVVLFTGGSGSAQGKALGELGREKVREFVKRGGGYVGVCAGSYLAMQGEEEFHKLRILAGRNLTGDFWKRGSGALPVAIDDPNASAKALRLHYANGPVFAAEPVEGLPRYHVLATFAGEMWSDPHGTHEGEMPGTPAILATRFGKGRILLFSPNPVLGAEGVGHPELMIDALRWVATPGAVAKKLAFTDVFASHRQDTGNTVATAAPAPGEAASTPTAP